MTGKNFFAMQKKHQEISRAGVEVSSGAAENFPKTSYGTHLLHSALREVLGTCPTDGFGHYFPKMRFDFPIPKK